MDCELWFGCERSHNVVSARGQKCLDKRKGLRHNSQVILESGKVCVRSEMHFTRSIRGFPSCPVFSLTISLVLWYKLFTLQIWSQARDDFWNLSSISESPQIIWFYCDTDCDSLNSRVAQVFILSNIDNMEYVILASLTETLKTFNKLCCWFKLMYSLLLTTLASMNCESDQRQERKIYCWRFS